MVMVIMKIVINMCYGGFCLSEKAIELYIQQKGLTVFKHNDLYITIPVEEYMKEFQKEEDAYRNNPKEFTGYKSNRFCWGENNIQRHDDILVKIVEQIGKEANGECANLQVIEIPDNVKYKIMDRDGYEWIAEVHRTWP